ncbi:hypothetical protein MY11210_003090 [Beauveria gryllotalpidicola]
MSPPRARSRVACQKCQGRKVKCDVAETATPCSNCRQHGQDCVVLPRKQHRKRNAAGELASRSKRRAIDCGEVHNSRNATTATASGHISVASPRVSRPSSSVQDQAARQVLQDAILDPSHPEAPQLARAAIPTRLPTRKPHEIEYMRHQGVFTKLPDDVCDELIGCYFQHVHFFLPILDVPTVLNEYWSRGSEGIDPLLLWSMFLASANFIGGETLEKAGFSSRKAMKTAMYNRAKCLYDFDQGTDKLTLIRSVILLAFWYSNPQDHRGAWYWIGIAISLAQAINLHRAPAATARNQRLVKISEPMARRIWWSLVVRDRWIAAAKGRPMRLRSDSHDLARPTRNDVLSELKQVNPEARSEFILEDVSILAGLWLRMVRVSDALGDALQLHHRVKGPEPSMEKVDQLLYELDEVEFAYSPSSDDDDVHVHTVQVEMLYQATIAILCRPYVLNATKPSAADENAKLKQSIIRRGREAASSTNDLVEQLIEMHAIEYMKPMIITAMVPATQIHLADCKSESTLTRRHGRNKLQLCVNVYAQLRSTYWSADVMYRLFKRAQDLAAGDSMQPSPREAPRRPETPAERQRAAQRMRNVKPTASTLVPAAALPPMVPMTPAVSTGTASQFGDMDQLLSPEFSLSEDIISTKCIVNMKFLASILFLLATGAAMLASVDRDGASPSTSNIVITSNNQDRSFLLWMSAEYDPKSPASVLLSFHGGGRNATDQLQLDGFTTAGANATPIVAYPQGLNDTWQGVPGDTANDVQFTHDILNYLETNYNVDTTRIYAAGKSDGGGFCNVLACDACASQRIAAFAPVSGAFYVDTLLPCDPDTVKLPCSPGRHSVAVIELHGGNDTTISYHGGERKGECLPAIPHFVRQWAVRNGLGLQNQTSKIADNTTLYTYGSGAEDAGLVTHVFESDIGHDWPSTAPNQDNSRKGHHVASYNATPMILDFFSKYQLPK